jgi:5-(carboxyamino)imidazole ribonucleotide synthase
MDLSDFLTGQRRLGILGGGQLGKMLARAAMDWHLPLAMLEAGPGFPAAPFARPLVTGDFRNEADVLRFGADLDVVTIEIENVAVAALEQLAEQGKEIHPHPAALRLIKDKGLQKNHYRDNGIPTAPYRLFPDAEALRQAVADGERSLPFVQKSRTGGYDGRGVAVIRTAADLDTKLLPGPCLAEDLVPIEKELAVIVARNSWEDRCFPTVEMSFDPEANLVELLFCPANIPPEIDQRAQEVARQVATSFGVRGLLAVELFLTQAGEILVNEVAPRPHNSGHHTIESCVTSQFQQHLRGVLDLPLGDTSLLRPAVMLNLLGAPGQTGPAHYEGLKQLLATPGVYPHVYGKEQTKPARKMGHITVLGDTVEAALEKARRVKEQVHVLAR